MTHKLTQHTINQHILIGLRILVFFISFSLLSGCSWLYNNWENDEDMHYRIEIKNETIHTIELNLTPSSPSGKYIIKPDSILHYNNFGVDKDQDVILDGLFGNDDMRFAENRIEVYWNDSLSLVWEGPTFEIADSINHSFFNISSWDHWTYDPALGIARFTVLPSDLDTY